MLSKAKVQVEFPTWALVGILRAFGGVPFVAYPAGCDQGQVQVHSELILCRCVC